MREKERDEFYDLFSLAKDSDGNYIKDRNGPANIKKFNGVVYPALEKMLKNIMEFKYDYIDISNIYARLFNKQELSQEKRNTAQKYKLSLPGIDRNVEAAVRSVSADSLSRSRANTNDAPALTQPVASHDQHTINGPNMTN